MTVPVAEAAAADTAPGNPLNAPGSPRRRKAARAKRRPGRPASRNLNDLPTQAERSAELDRRKAEAAAGGTGTDSPPTPPPAPVAVSPGPFAGGAVHGSAGAVLGVFGMALFLNFMQGGLPQCRRWGAAKFLNKTN